MKAKSVMYEDCRHEAVNSTGYCSSCGAYIAAPQEPEMRDVYYASLKSAENQSLIELNKLPLPEHVADIARKRLAELPHSELRSSHRPYVLYACVYSAYLTTKAYLVMSDLANWFGFSPEETSKAQAEYRRLALRLNMPSIHVASPISILEQLTRSYFEGLLTPEYIEMLTTQNKAFAEALLTKNPALRDKYPQRVAAGILRHRIIDSNPLWIIADRIEKLTQLSTATIVASCKDVEKCLAKKL